MVSPLRILDAMIDKPSRPFALGSALAVTVISASSVVVMKIGLDYMGPLTATGLRFLLAFLALLPFMARNGNSVPKLSRRSWGQLLTIGIGSCAIGNGALVWGLEYVPATTASFLTSFIPLLVLFASILWLREAPSRLQVAGAAICAIGSALFFSPGVGPGEPRGLFLISIALAGSALYGVVGRQVARDGQIDTLALTALPLAVGGGCLCLVGLVVEGWPALSMTAWGIVIWLALVNTALVNVLYNHSLRVLTALEVSAILNLTPLATALLAWVILRENLESIQVLGMVIVITGVMLVDHASQRARQPLTQAAQESTS